MTAKKRKKKKHYDPPPALIQPIGDDYMPLFSAVLWIATEGFKQNWKRIGQLRWTSAYKKLVTSISRGAIEILGDRKGITEVIPSEHFKSIEIVRFWDGFDMRRAESGKLYLTSGFYADDVQWLNGNSDKLVRGVTPEWTLIVIKKADVARKWSFGLSKASSAPLKTSDRRPIVQTSLPSSGPAALEISFDVKGIVSVGDHIALGTAESCLVGILEQVHSEDRKKRRASDKYQYLSAKEIAEELNLSEVYTRKLVSRIRKTVAQALPKGHGTPSANLFIQNKRPFGYRLHPQTLVIRTCS